MPLYNNTEVLLSSAGIFSLFAPWHYY